MTRLAEKIKQYTLGEEIANSVSHGIGVVLGIVALPTLLIFASFSEVDRGYKIAASIVYCLAMIALYLSSTLYHSLTNERAKRIFKILDHASIYLLIAGTYTPFCLVTLRHDGGWVLFGVLWGMTVLGMATEALWVFRPKWVSVVIYLVMGWMAVWVIPDMIRLLPPTALWLLLAGGISYSVGTIFYVIKRVRYFHSVFHVWVLLGTFLHFFAILLYVVM
ncbi:MAG: hemolysin III family protein [Coriobacteriia bacterium]|nr:hemolysin III family protein [Coriobacteriia bacterium]